MKKIHLEFLCCLQIFLESLKLHPHELNFFFSFMHSINIKLRGKFAFNNFLQALCFIRNNPFTENLLFGLVVRINTQFLVTFIIYCKVIWQGVVQATKRNKRFIRTPNLFLICGVTENRRPVLFLLPEGLVQYVPVMETIVRL